MQCLIGAFTNQTSNYRSSLGTKPRFSLELETRGCLGIKHHAAQHLSLEEAIIYISCIDKYHTNDQNTFHAQGLYLNVNSETTP